jgi:hypothetical protein
MQYNFNISTYFPHGISRDSFCNFKDILIAINSALRKKVRQTAGPNFLGTIFVRFLRVIFLSYDTGIVKHSSLKTTSTFIFIAL